MRLILTILIAIFVTLWALKAEAQVHDGSALFKNSLRQECYERYGADLGCGAPLEEWLNQWESVQICQHRNAFMCARAEAAFNRVAGRPDGFNSYTVAHCGQGVAQYIVPANIAFQDYDKSVGGTVWPWYPNLTAAIRAHIVAGQATMRNYIGNVNALYANETYHRRLLGLPPALPLPPPVFTNINQ
jgi:hypothetical protein